MMARSPLTQPSALGADKPAANNALVEDGSGKQCLPSLPASWKDVLRWSPALVLKHEAFVLTALTGRLSTWGADPPWQPLY